MIHNDLSQTSDWTVECIAHKRGLSAANLRTINENGEATISTDKVRSSFIIHTCTARILTPTWTHKISSTKYKYQDTTQDHYITFDFLSGHFRLQLARKFIQPTGTPPFTVHRLTLIINFIIISDKAIYWKEP